MSLTPPLSFSLPPAIDFTGIVEFNFEAVSSKIEKSSHETDPLSPSIILEDTLVNDAYKKEFPHKAPMGSNEFRKICIIRKIKKFNYFYNEMLLSARSYIRSLLDKNLKVQEKSSFHSDLSHHKKLNILKKLKKDSLSMEELCETFFQKLKKCPVFYKEEDINIIRYCFLSAFKSNNVEMRFLDELSLETKFKETNRSYSKLYWCLRVFYSVIGIQSSYGYAILIFNELVDNGIIKSDAPLRIINGCLSSRSNHQFEQILLSILKSYNDITKEDLIRDICYVFPVRDHIKNDEAKNALFNDIMQSYYELGDDCSLE